MPRERSDEILVDHGKMEVEVDESDEVKMVQWSLVGMRKESGDEESCAIRI
jgi:hypothetical protein